MPKLSDEQYSEEETARRRDDVIRRMANMPPKPHSAMKVGKRKAKLEPSKPSPRRGKRASAEKAAPAS
jgi:hypothetical protein